MTKPAGWCLRSHLFLPCRSMAREMSFKTTHEILAVHLCRTVTLDNYIRYSRTRLVTWLHQLADLVVIHTVICSERALPPPSFLRYALRRQASFFGC